MARNPYLNDKESPEILELRDMIRRASPTVLRRARQFRVEIEEGRPLPREMSEDERLAFQICRRGAVTPPVWLWVKHELLQKGFHW